MSVSLFAGSLRSIDSNEKTMRKFDSFVDMFSWSARDKTGQRSKSVAQSPQKVAGCEYHYLRKSIEWSSSWRDDEENFMSSKFIKHSSFAFYPSVAIVENEER
jgi:hypothetical protein